MPIEVLDYLQDMRDEIKEDSRRLERKVDSVDAKVDNLDTKIDDHAVRLVKVEATTSTVRWLAGALIVGAIAAVGDLVVNHYSERAAANAVTLQLQGGKR